VDQRQRHVTNRSGWSFPSYHLGASHNAPSTASLPRAVSDRQMSLQSKTSQTSKYYHTRSAREHETLTKCSRTPPTVQYEAASFALTLLPPRLSSGVSRVKLPSRYCSERHHHCGFSSACEQCMVEQHGDDMVAQRPLMMMMMIGEYLFAKSRSLICFYAPSGRLLCMRYCL